MGNTMCKTPPPTLTYFPIASRGETARLIAAVGEVEIIDNKAGGLNHTDLKPIDHFSPGTMPMLTHGDFTMAQSLPVESYLASISPKYCSLTPKQKAIDGVVCAIKEDVNVLCAQALFKPEKDKKVISKFLDKWWGIVEHKCPESGFFNGLSYPTGADLACLVMTQGYMPFCACQKQAGMGMDYYKKFKKLSALVERTMAYPVVAEYLKTHTTLKQAAFGK